MSKKLATYVHVNGEVYGPDDKVPADVAKQITNPKAWADGSAPDDDSGSASYSSLKKDELEAEVASRGLDVSGTKAELVAALEAHDAENA